VDFEFETFEGARHGFAVLDHPVYDAAAADRHWQVLRRLFADTLT
jgi:carboxymethylenebutenolidase